MKILHDFTKMGLLLSSLVPMGPGDVYLVTQYAQASYTINNIPYVLYFFVMKYRIFN